MNSVTTINDLPQEVLYMIMDLLVYPERIRCRLVSKHFMFVASYIFNTVHFSSRERVKFFSEAIKKNPCIATHVQIIKVDNAALLRAINQTGIKQACFNVKEIEILHKQGKGTWAQHLLPYKRLQHTPVLQDDLNAKIVLDNYAHQMLTLRIGGKYLKDMSVDDICRLFKSVPNIRTIGLHYLFKEKHRELDRDLPHTFNFKDLNIILKQVPGLMRFELKNCEVADVSLLFRNRESSRQELLQHVRSLSSVTKSYNLFDQITSLRQLEMNNVKVSHVTWFVQSILKGFPNLESLSIQFAPRDYILESSAGTHWDSLNLNDWTDFELSSSKLKKLELSHTDGRLSIPKIIEVLGDAGACLEDISLCKTSSGSPPLYIITLIATSFADTLEHLTLDNLRGVGIESIWNLRYLKTASFNWQHNDRDSLLFPIEIVRSLPELTKVALGYSAHHSRIHLVKSSEIIVNLTSITLDRVVMSQGQLKQFFLPLINLKEAIFRYCVFEYDKDYEKDDDYSHTEIFDNRPSSGMRMDMVRKKFFDRLKEEDKRLYAEDAQKEKDFNREKLFALHDDNSGPSYYTPRRYNLQVRSLSLEHLGLHDCRLRDVIGGISTARAIRNFEVIQDKRSGIHNCYDVDRAYHEKKNCNPHIIYNKKKVSEDTVSYHFTHEFGGTTGKNNYLVSRPTFMISMFSLEKLSIRPNAVMSVYFTGVDGNRLKDCDTAVKEEVEKQNALEATNQITMFLESTQNINFDDLASSDGTRCKFDPEVEKVNEVLSKVLPVLDTARESDSFTLDKAIFDSELFAVKSHPSCSFAKYNQMDEVEDTERPRKRNKKTLAIRPF